MDDLVLDAESLFNIADIIDAYCAKQREVVNVYYDQIMALESEWRDDETFGAMVDELKALRAQVMEIIDEVCGIYSNYFRKRAQQIIERPIYHPDLTTVSWDSSTISGEGIGASHGRVWSYVGYETYSDQSRNTTIASDGADSKSSTNKGVFNEEKGVGESRRHDSVISDAVEVSNETKKNSLSNTAARNLSVTKQTWDKYSYPGGEVYDTPIATGRILDSDQGKVPGYNNTCGIVSCVNVARLAGLSTEEFDAVDIAIKNDLCNKYRKGRFGKAHQGGATFPESRKEILKHLGIDSYLEDATIDNIAKRVAEGKGVIISVRAGKLWNKRIKGLHAITVTSVQRGYDGAIQGFFVCDSGRHNSADASAYYSAAEIQSSLTPNRPMNVTTNIIR